MDLNNFPIKPKSFDTTDKTATELANSHSKLHPSVKVDILLEGVALSKNYIPTYATSLSSGFDIKAAIETSITLPPGHRTLVTTGLRMKVPSGYELQIRPKSGLALNHGITVLNSPGTVDSDFNLGIGVILINHGQNNFVIEPGMKIAQGVICPVYQADFNLVQALEKVITDKQRTGGFGSTGLF